MDANIIKTPHKNHHATFELGKTQQKILLITQVPIGGGLVAKIVNEFSVMEYEEGKEKK